MSADNRIYIASLMFLMHTIKNIATKFAHIHTKIMHNKYVYLHQQLFYFELPIII